MAGYTIHAQRAICMYLVCAHFTGVWLDLMIVLMGLGLRGGRGRGHIMGETEGAYLGGEREAATISLEHPLRLRARDYACPPGSGRRLCCVPWGLACSPREPPNRLSGRPAVPQEHLPLALAMRSTGHGLLPALPVFSSSLDSPESRLARLLR